MRLFILSIALLASAAAGAQDEATEVVEPVDSETNRAANSDSVKTMSGMSILGNEEAPKSLVIVPWKSSRLGDGLGISDALDESPTPVDKEVFMRELHFYGLRLRSED